MTEEFGSAIRISSVLTNAVLDTGTPINESRCGIWPTIGQYNVELLDDMLARLVNSYIN